MYMYLQGETCSIPYKGISVTTFYRQLITWANIDVNSDLNPNSHSDEIMKDIF